MYNDLLADFVFRPAVEDDDVFWRSIEDSTNPADFETYLKRFPSGAHRTSAIDRLGTPANGAAVLGRMYETGSGVAQDYAAALRWYRHGAHREFALAQSRLGRMYEYGRGVARNYAAALRWYRRAADQGDAGGQASLGRLHEYGRGVTRDYAAAVGWFRRAADQGDAGGQYGLGFMHANGRGVARDYAAALGWFRRAADQGDAGAQNGIDRLERRRHLESSGWTRIPVGPDH